MVEDRPYDQRPAARPADPASVSAAAAPPQTPAGNKSGCFPGCLIGIGVVVAIAVLGSIIGSISGGSETSSSGNYAPAAPAMTVDDRYVSAVRANSQGEAVGVSDADLISLAKQVCQSLDDGITIDQLVLGVAAQGINVSLAGAVMGAGIPAYCPQHQGQADEYSR